jgi:hypothetical protein
MHSTSIFTAILLGAALASALPQQCPPDTLPITCANIGNSACLKRCFDAGAASGRCLAVIACGALIRCECTSAKRSGEVVDIIVEGGR